VAEFRDEQPVAGPPAGLAGRQRFGVAQVGPVVVCAVVVERPGADELEAQHQERERDHAEDHRPGALGHDHQPDDDVGEDRREHHPVEQDAPEAAAGLGLGHEHVQQEVLLQPGVQPEVERRHQQDDGLQRGEAEGHRRVEEEVVVVAGVVEGGRRGPLDRLPRRRRQEGLGEPDPGQVDDLHQVDGGAEVPLQQPGHPEGRHLAERVHDLGVELAVLDGVPGVLVAVLGVDDGGHERPRRGEQREDDEVVEDEERVEMVEDVALARGLGHVAGPDGQPAEDDGQDQIDQRRDQRRRDTLDGGPDPGVLVERGLEGRPDQAQVRQVRQEHGDQRVGRDPHDRQQRDPDHVDEALPLADALGQRQVLPDDVVGPGRQADGRAVGVLVARRVGDGVGVLDRLPAGEAVGHGVALVDRVADVLDLHLQLVDAVGQEVDGVDLAVGKVAPELARRTHGRTVRGQPIGPLQVLCQHRLQPPHRLLVLLDQPRQLLDVAANGRAGEGRRRVDLLG